MLVVINFLNSAVLRHLLMEDICLDLDNEFSVSFLRRSIKAKIIDRQPTTKKKLHRNIFTYAPVLFDWYLYDNVVFFISINRLSILNM